MSDENPYHCPICDASFESIEEVERHNSQYHRANTRAETPKAKAAAPRKNKVFTRQHTE
jgi:hypothetical protein